MKKRYIALNNKVRGVKKGEEFVARSAIGRALVAVGAAKLIEDDQPPPEADKPTVEEVVPPKINASKGAMTAAKEHKIDLSTVQGSGEGGRIIKPDITVLLDNENTGF